jgi:hypothetical protein
MDLAGEEEIIMEVLGTPLERFDVIASNFNGDRLRLIQRFHEDFSVNYSWL